MKTSFDMGNIWFAFFTDVAFKAIYGGNNMSTDAEVKFQNILLNVGGGYSSNTGLFRAPIYGLYSFTTQICEYEYLSVQIRKQGSYSTLTQLYSSNLSICGTTTSVLYLNKFDAVGVYSNFNVNFTDYNQFTGYLIYQLSWLIS